jgi:hypothetical protein
MRGLFDDCAEQDMAAAMDAVRGAAGRELAHLVPRIGQQHALDEAEQEAIVGVARQALRAARGSQLAQPGRRPQASAG